MSYDSVTYDTLRIILARLADGRKIADHDIVRLCARIMALEIALRHLDDMIVDLDAGHIELPKVSRFIDAALKGGKDG